MSFSADKAKAKVSSEQHRHYPISSYAREDHRPVENMTVDPDSLDYKGSSPNYPRPPSHQDAASTSYGLPRPWRSEVQPQAKPWSVGRRQKTPIPYPHPYQSDSRTKTRSLEGFSRPRSSSKECEDKSHIDVPLTFTTGPRTQAEFQLADSRRKPARLDGGNVGIRGDVILYRDPEEPQTGETMDEKTFSDSFGNDVDMPYMPGISPKNHARCLTWLRDVPHYSERKPPQEP